MAEKVFCWYQLKPPPKNGEGRRKSSPIKKVKARSIKQALQLISQLVVDLPYGVTVWEDDK